ncbi:major facilitator superfamily domain-containing protein [Exophiala viscosa]|uniref:major facilitator superfamily domain-containing protein n=1 Tax=Exophiala viscosa TaxID=2486360 RepID=UPI00219AFA2E|nr:major facilitator superfamily domain-containing protein [Exophiala viscosa]
MAAAAPKEEPQATTASSPPSLSSVEAGAEAEKSVVQDATVDLDRVGETEGYVLDEAQLRAQLGLAPDVALKKSNKGVVLIPQPTADPEDPLNWSRLKKTLILVVIAINACTADYSAATGASALIPQAEQWHISPNTVNHATAGNTFMLGVGGLAAVWLSAYFGRLPVLFWFGCLSAGMAAWSAAAKSFDSYMTARILQGTFAVAGAAGGLMWIKDVFFFHQHAKKINIWSTAIILSPFLGPQFMAAILSVNTWRVGMWLNFGLIALGVLVTATLGDETFYPRHLMPDRIPQRKSRLLRVIGVEQYRTKYTTNTFWEAGSRLAYTATRLPVILVCLFYFFDFPWTIGNNTTISVLIIPAYNFSYRNLAAIYTAPVVGAVLGLFIGHFLFDFIGKLYAKRHGGRIEPESRLIVLWLILPIKLIGYNLIGTTLHHAHTWSYWVLAVGWCMHNAATIITTTAVGAYLLDAYPEAGGECAAWLNFVRTLGGFIVGYIQINWATKSGTQTEYGIQSAIMGAAFFIVVLLQFFGARLRHAQGRLNFKTN